MEYSVYKIHVPDEYNKHRTLDFVAWHKGTASKAIVLGFAPHDKPLHEETRDEAKIRETREMCNRTMMTSNHYIEGDNGKFFDERWKDQAVLVALWRKLQKLEFLRLPQRNPFLGKRPKHYDVIDYEARFRYFKDYERQFPNFKV